MLYKIKTISSSGVNCYLVTTGDGGFVLIDSGLSMGRARIVKQLESAGCLPGKLKLILITHADSDHTGNAAFLRRKYSAKIAIHPAEVKAAQSGKMLDNRKSVAGLSRLIFSITQTGKSDRFTPDFTVEDGQDLSPYGLEAKVIHLPGHTFGEIGILTAQGDMFCGDMLMENTKGLRFGYGDPSDFIDSLEKLNALEIKTFYPGHGKPFSGEEFRKFYKAAR
jgi:glyoxylase-like metal-dependent hydrolase (beta-lactamase superfamily II)